MRLPYFIVAFTAWSLMSCASLNTTMADSATDPLPETKRTSSTALSEVPSSSSAVFHDLARSSAISALSADENSLRDLQKHSVALEKQQNPSEPQSKISDKISLLEAWLAQNPTDQKTLLKKIVRSDPDPMTLRQARHALQADPLAQIHRLRRENHYNEATGLANYVFHLASNILTLNTESLPRLLVDFAFIWEPFVALSPQDRSAIVAYDQHGDEIHARGARSGMESTIHRLRERLKDKMVREQMQVGEWNMEHERWSEAYAAFDQAERIQPGLRKAQQGKLAAGRRMSADYRQQIRLLAVPPQPNITESETRSEKQLAAVIVAGSPAEIRKQAEEFRKNHPASSLSDDAAFAEWTADELEKPASSGGSYAEAYLRSPSARGSNAAGHLRAFDAQPAVSPAATLQKADANLKSDVRSYVLTGRNEDPDYPAIYPGMREQAHAIAASFGLFLPFDWVRRSVQVAVANPVNDSEWRAAAVKYLGSTDPQSPEARKVAGRLAESLERQGMLNQARTYHASAFEEDPQYTRKLDEKAAQRMRETAEAQTDNAQRRSLLELTSKRFPGTKAAGKARRSLEKIDKKNLDMYQIRKADLIGWPDLWLNRGLRLDPQWFDGNKDNGEMGDDGVHFLAPDGRSLKFTIRFPEKEEEKRITPDAASYKEIEARLAVWKREAEARSRAEAILDRPAFLLNVEGSAGPGGFDVYPQLQPITFDEETLPLYRSPLEASK